MPRPPLHNEHLYAVEQEALRHDDAVTWFGEMTACVMFWSLFDFKRNLVERCSICTTQLGQVVADAYRQPTKAKCPECYGTTFAGGIRAILYRPVLWDERPISEDQRERGITRVSSGTAQITHDFNMRDGDILVRADRTRWKIGQPEPNEVSTGFGPTGLQQSPGFSFQVQLQDQSSVAYTVPIDEDVLTRVGWNPVLPFPDSNDVINGPLFINDLADPVP